MKNDLFSTVETAPENLTTRQKKVLFRAWHRGTREADLLMGRFADRYIPQASQREIDCFETLLGETDPDIYDWITGRMALPENDLGSILAAMRVFYEINGA